MKRVCEASSKDPEALVELGQLQEQHNIPAAIQAYERAQKLLETRKQQVPPELWNNIGALRHHTSTSLTYLFVVVCFIYFICFFYFFFLVIVLLVVRSFVCESFCLCKLHYSRVGCAYAPVYISPLVYTLLIYSTIFYSLCNFFSSSSYALSFFSRASKLESFADAEKAYMHALGLGERSDNAKIDFHTANVTTVYNLARLFEDTHEDASADALYRQLSKEHPTYVDCTLF